MHEKAAICEICGEAIYVEVDRELGSTASLAPAGDSGLNAVVERAAREHLARHPSAVVERFLLRKHLDDLAPDVRPTAVKEVYSHLRELWGDEDRKGVYSIDEALGCMAVYQLWCNANRCTWERCRHQPN
jgi:hypothetical protein